MKRPLCTRLDLLKPSVQEHVSNKQLEQKKHHDVRSKDRFFQVGQPVLVRNFRDGPKWVPGCVSVREGPVTYGVEVNGQLWKRHADQLLDQRGHMVEQPATGITGLPYPELPCDPVTSPEILSGTPSACLETPTEDLDGCLESEETSDSLLLNSPVPQRYPQRSRRPPERFEPSFK